MNATKTILAAATEYVEKRGIAKTPIYAAKRFIRYVGDIPLADLTAEVVEAYRDEAQENEVPEWTIAGTLKDIRTIARANQIVVDIVVRRPGTDPHPCDFSVIDRVMEHLQPWGRQLVVLGYWTCQRLDDLIALQCKLDPDAHHLAAVASKTKHQHAWPIPDWLRPWLADHDLPYRRATDHSQDLVRNEMERASKAAGVARLMPSTLRKRALTEWSKIDCGSIQHGCGIGDTRTHYVPPMEILESNCRRLRLPESFRIGGVPETEQDGAEVLLAAYRSLDPESQKLLVSMAERMRSR